jgi:hypothetical protein
MVGIEMDIRIFRIAAAGESAPLEIIGPTCPVHSLQTSGENPYRFGPPALGDKSIRARIEVV